MTNTLSNTKVKPFSVLKFRKNTDSIWHGNVVDKKAVVSQFGYYVRSIARKILRTLSSCIELDDLISYGMMGLLEAAERYDPKKGVSFTTFSYYRIKGAIYDGLRGMG